MCVVQRAGEKAATARGPHKLSSLRVTHIQPGVVAPTALRKHWLRIQPLLKGEPVPAGFKGNHYLLLSDAGVAEPAGEPSFKERAGGGREAAGTEGPEGDGSARPGAAARPSARTKGRGPRTRLSLQALRTRPSPRARKPSHPSARDFLLGRRFDDAISSREKTTPPPRASSAPRPSRFQRSMAAAGRQGSPATWSLWSWTPVSGIRPGAGDKGGVGGSAPRASGRTRVTRSTETQGILFQGVDFGDCS
ncbi:uncharacterized protein LOC111544140 [Piliocolobus tephrosceles]|uniref:uncharacterized protein LOC111544140 n=1 Tax=Piliocolobus tephrosceles TaxID=591936 RepID=UPI0013011A7D|nr:uncharacterized protein LOC111544140 [Piliocolobus tephrosceles]